MDNILITGVSTGIGYETTKFFLGKEDYFVFGSVRNQKDADRLSKVFGKKFHPLIMDVTDLESIDIAVKEVQKRTSEGLSLLVNNAGIAVAGPLKHVKTEDFERQMDVNVTGVLNVTNAFLSLLGGDIKTKFKAGKIINISSVSGLFSSPFLGPYCISKHALESLTDTYRRELSVYGIKVVVVEPGPTKSEIWSKSSELAAKYLDTDYGRIWKGMNKRLAASEANSIPTIQVSRKLYKIYKKKNPWPRYMVTKNKFLKWTFFYFMPEIVSDYFIKKSLRRAIHK